MEQPRKRVGIYLDESLIERFKLHHQKFGDMTTTINDLLRVYLEGLDSGAEQMRLAREVSKELTININTGD